MTDIEFKKLIKIEHTKEAGVFDIFGKCPYCDYEELTAVHNGDFYIAELLLISNLIRHVEKDHGVSVIATN